MENKGIVSVIIPAYNAEKKIEAAVQSVLQQTYPFLECIVVDDGSQDKTGMLLDEMAKKEKRLQVCHKENGGVSQARNCGLSMAQGEYIAFLDSDDWMEPDMLEALLQAMYNGNAQLAVCGYTIHQNGKETAYSMDQLAVFEGDGTSAVIGKAEGEDAGKSPSAVFEELVVQYYMNAVWNKLYRKELIDFTFEPDISLGEDFRFNLYYMEHVTQMALRKGTLYHYVRDDSGHSLTSQMPEDRLYVVRENFGRAIALYEKWGGSDGKKLRDSCARQCLAVLAGLSRMEGSSWKKRRQIIQECFSDAFLWRCLKEYRPDEAVLKLLLFALRRRPAGLINLFHAFLCVGLRKSRDTGKEKERANQ
ncbi:MAG: glycosyltransferase [Clostridiaceae bacterium]|nr:glycosyltransferase [Clostridiaceae bacterium]